MLESILAAHFEKYPAMRPEDAVKLIYQNEFGPGHMIPDAQRALARLRQETAALSPDAQEALYEAIGNGLCRLNLRACMARGLPEPEINRLFCETAQAVAGDEKRFRKKLDELVRMAERDETPFLAAELDYYLILYREKGCPAVSHSPAFQAAYHPAYRVVLQKKLKDFLAGFRAQTTR